MPTRSRPVVVSTRVSEHDRARIRALAELEGVTVSEALYEILIGSVRDRLVELLSPTDQPPSTEHR